MVHTTTWPKDAYGPTKEKGKLIVRHRLSQLCSL